MVAAGDDKARRRRAVRAVEAAAGTCPFRQVTATETAQGFQRQATADFHWRRVQILLRLSNIRANQLDFGRVGLSGDI